MVFGIKINNILKNNKIYHPNIDMDGNVCLNILRNDWRPIYTISTILFGLNELFKFFIYYLKIIFKFFMAN